MKLEQLQHDLLVRLVKCVSILTLLGSGLYALGFYVHKQEEQYNLIKSELMSLTRKLEGLNRKTLEFSDAVRVWDELTEGQKQLQGLQLTEAKALLEKWQAQFKLSDVNISFSKPEESGGIKDPAGGKVIGKKDTEPSAPAVSAVKVMSSDVSISLKALSDEYVYQFIDALQHQFPGYVRIKTFTLTQETPVSKEVIQRIAEGEAVPIVSGNIDFSWRDLQYIPAESADHPPSVNGASL